MDNVLKKTKKKKTWKPLKATYVYDEADMCRLAEERIKGGKQRCGSESRCAFLSSQRPLDRQEWTVSGHWQHVDVDLK